MQSRDKARSEKSIEGDQTGWLQVLDELEVSLDNAARAGAVDGDSIGTGVQWSVPENLGDLPAELKQRARDVLTNQLNLICELRDARRAIGLQLAAVRLVPTVRASGTSVFLDVMG